jgi:mannose/fructose/N-acetylgalactosamine-specific phosphotransferase system component IIB
MMAVTLVRIDDRLIHGQVVLGWARVLKADRIVVANDRIAANEWERRLYAASVPPHVAVSFSPVERLESEAAQGQSVIVLFESVADLHKAVRSGAGFEEVNVGGLHYREGTKEVLPYVYLSEEDRSALKSLVESGVRLVARDIPGNPAVDLRALLVHGGTLPSGGI